MYKSVVALDKEVRAWFLNILKFLPHLAAVVTQVNFIFLKLSGSFTAESVRETLLKKGFIIRDASIFKGLNGQFIRIAIKDHQCNQALFLALKELFS